VYILWLFRYFSVTVLVFFFDRSIVDEYLQPEHMNLPVTGILTSELGHSTLLPQNFNVVGRSVVSTALKSVGSVEQINSNITLICLLLEGIERCSEVLGSGFQTELIEVLYPLLVKVDCENARVSRTAVLALGGVARSCGASDPADLLHRNADYIVDAVSLRLRHVTRHPEAPSVLAVVLRHGSVSMLTVFHDVLLEVCERFFGNVVSCRRNRPVKSFLLLRVVFLLRLLTVGVLTGFPRRP